MERETIVLDLIQTFELNIKEILNYKILMNELNLSSKDYIIAIVNIDYELGNVLGQLLFEKKTDEQFCENQPFFVRGLAKRVSIQKKLDIINKAMADKLLNIINIPVIVVDKNMIEIFSIE